MKRLIAIAALLGTIVACEKQEEVAKWKSTADLLAERKTTRESEPSDKDRIGAGYLRWIQAESRAESFAFSSPEAKHAREQVAAHSAEFAPVASKKLFNAVREFQMELAKASLDASQAKNELTKRQNIRSIAATGRTPRDPAIPFKYSQLTDEELSKVIAEKAAALEARLNLTWAAFKGEVEAAAASGD